MRKKHKLLTSELPKNYLEETENLNDSVSIKEFESITKKLSTKKTLCPDNFPGGFRQPLKKKSNINLTQTLDDNLING